MIVVNFHDSYPVENHLFEITRNTYSADFLPAPPIDNLPECEIKPVGLFHLCQCLIQICIDHADQVYADQPGS